MTRRVLNFGDFSLSVPDGWLDVTHTLDDPQAPLTVADPVAGVGALQLSPAIYKAGRSPDVKPRDLRSLLDDFASRRGLSVAFDRSTSSDALLVEGASYHAGDDLVRVWYASDGQNLILATYVCAWDEREREASQRETSVRSIRFTRPTPGESA